MMKKSVHECAVRALKLRSKRVKRVSVCHQKHYKEVMAKSQERALRRLHFVVCVFMICSSNCDSHCVDEIEYVQSVNVDEKERVVDDVEAAAGCRGDSNSVLSDDGREELTRMFSIERNLRGLNVDFEESVYVDDSCMVCSNVFEYPQVQAAGSMEETEDLSDDNTSVSSSFESVSSE